MKLALIGDPVSHSRSPAMHAAAGEATGVSLTYEALRVSAHTAEETLRRLHDEGYAGLNVTVPLKIEVLDALRADPDAVVDPAAERIGAVNTLVRAGSSWRGFNTDAPGFVRSLPGELPERVLVLGAGGA
ncbi:MAG: shikimate dehydrogenase, partial [Myxococcota bacterium]